MGIILIILFLIIFPRFNIVTASENLLYNSFATNTVETFSRMKQQIPAGVYDPVSNKTFIVYPSGVTTSGLSATDPYIIYYNHTNQTWSSELRIAQSPVTPDSHNYPSIVIDNNGYLHVFHTFHNTHQIMHAVSQNPRNITTWNVSYMPNTDHATYGAAFKAQNGDIYLLYRKTIVSQPPLWYEPEVYLKSIDNGQTWTEQTLIDPLQSNDLWNTVYTKSVYYSANPEGLHITFSIHKEHNTYFNRHYYIFFKFSNNHLYSASGQDLGTTIVRSEFESCCEIFHYDQDLLSNNYGSGWSNTIVSLDNNSRPLIFYSYYLVGEPNTNKAELHLKSWNGSAWVDQILNIGPIIFPLGAIYRNNNDIDLYLRIYNVSQNHPSYIYHYDGTSWQQGQYIYDSNFPSGSGVGHMSEIANYHPDLRGTFMVTYPPINWTEPQPKGIFYAYKTLINNTPTPALCLKKNLGDANCDNILDGIDYSIWLNSQCNPGANQQCADIKADFNSDSKVNDIDYSIWFNNRYS